jgi:VanZ family protein
MTNTMIFREIISKLRSFIKGLSKYPWLYYWFPFIFIAGLEYYLSSKSTLPRPPFVIPNMDKFEHGTIYAGMGFFAKRAFKFSNLPVLSEIPGICAILFCIFYGFSDEIHQSFVPNRETDIMDVLADSIGGIIGQWIYSLKIVDRVFDSKS